MVLHIFPNEKFTIDYVERINSIYPLSNHRFYIYGSSHKYCCESDLLYDNVSFIDNLFKCKELKTVYQKADTIVLHSLFHSTKDLLLLLFWHMCFKRRLVWVLWGGDLYDSYRNYKNASKTNIRVQLHEFLRKSIISKLDVVVTSNDYKQLKKWYKTQAKQLKGVYSYKFKPITEDNSNKNNDFNVMVGHSATETCCHLETFETINKFDNENKVKVYCPLSYPNNAEYISKVIKKGEECFESRFNAVVDYMDYFDYVKFLNRIDVGVFNNDRQQGMGNIINLLYLGKKVYMNKNNTLFDVLKEEGFYIYDFEKISEDMFLPLSSEEKEKNRNLVVFRYSDEHFKELWDKIFYN